MDDPTLARLEHANMIDWLRITAGQVRGSVVAVEGGVAVIATGVPMPLFNQVIVEPDGGTEDGMRRAIGVMRDVGAPFYVVLRHGPDDALVGTVIDLGLHLEGDRLPGMVLNPIPTAEPPPLPAGHDIRRVIDEAGLADHVRVAADGFAMPPSIVRDVVGVELWARPGCAVYVGYTDGEPVSTGFSVRTGQTLGVYAIATAEAARRRGYGAAMTARLIADGAADGCDVAALQASDMGRPIYERLGFRLVVEYDVWFGRRPGTS